jgi:putative ABC transport system substrate-binding protein
MESRFAHARAALRIVAVLCLAMSGAYAQANEDLRLPRFVLPDAGGDFEAALEGLLEQLRRGGDANRAYARDFELAPLAELDEHLRRPEAQSALGQGKGAIAVIYPQLGEPYRGVFAKIIEGIEDRAKAPVIRIPVAAGVEAAELNARLKRDGVKAVIALGRQGLKASSGLSREIAMVVGGVLVPPEGEHRNLSGISLTPDPALLFGRLKSLMPHVKRVIVVFDPKQSGWLIGLAREAARAQNLEMVEFEARDLAAAARAYETAFAGADSKRDAVWLPQDATTVEEGTILPLVLKESWERSVPIFSSSFLHVKKGALFALYPNNFELGRNLASSALAAMAGEVRKPGVAPLRELQVAVNLRSASHFGLNIGYQQQRGFDFVFPEP